MKKKTNIKAGISIKVVIEIDMLEQWKEHLDKLAAMKPEGIAALQLHIRKVAEMMGNRIKMLKRE